MSNIIYRGFVDNSVLPIHKGMEVTISKGTVVDGVRKEPTKSTRNQTVKVDHVLPGMSICVGHFFFTPGEVSFQYHNREDIETVRKLYGTTDLAELWPLMTLKDCGHYVTLFLPVKNPTVA